MNVSYHTWTMFFAMHVDGIHKFLKALQHIGVKFQQEKCELFCWEVQYGGHLMSAEGVRIDPKDLEDKTHRQWATSGGSFVSSATTDHTSGTVL